MKLDKEDKENLKYIKEHKGSRIDVKILEAFIRKHIDPTCRVCPTCPTQVRYAIRRVENWELMQSKMKQDGRTKSEA